MFGEWYKPGCTLDFPIGGSQAMVDALVRCVGVYVCAGTGTHCMPHGSSYRQAGTLGNVPSCRSGLAALHRC